MRLAEHVAGTVDVDGMLDSMTPAQFDEWCVKDQVEPIGYSAQALGMIAWFIHSYLASDSDATAQDFMPWTRFAPPPKANNAAARRMIESLARRMPDGQPR
jgi:hypothetical protein